jgi:hypothetical protein
LKYSPSLSGDEAARGVLVVDNMVGLPFSADCSVPAAGAVLKIEDRGGCWQPGSPTRAAAGGRRRWAQVQEALLSKLSHPPRECATVYAAATALQRGLRGFWDMILLAC